MTSRTNRHSGGRNQGDLGEGAPFDLEQRRQLAVERYLAGDPIAVICQELGCKACHDLLYISGDFRRLYPVGIV
jgi:hypothetical protein